MADDQNQTVPVPEGPEQKQPAQPYQQVPPYAQPQQPVAPGQPVGPYGQQQQPVAPGQPVNPYGQPMPGYYPQPAKSGKATGALVCGIFAILLAWAPLFGIVLGIVAIVLAVKAVKEAGKDGKATGGKVCGIIGIVLSVLSFILYLVIGFGAMAYIAANPEIVASISDEPALSLPGDAKLTDEGAQVEPLAKAKLDLAKNKDAAFVQKLASELDDEFVGSAGYRLSELGVDPLAVADWLLTDFDYQLDGAYTYDDGTGTVYAEVTLRDVSVFADTFNADVQAFVDASESASLDEAAVKAKLGELFNAAMAKTSAMTDDYVSVEMVKRDGTWTVVEDVWEDEMEFLFGSF